jgi:hypothetical protein
MPDPIAGVRTSLAELAVRQGRDADGRAPRMVKQQHEPGPPMKLTNQLQAWAAQLGPETNPAEFQNELNEALKLLGRWRSSLLANTYIARQGPRVFQGPFVGMEYVAGSTSGALMPRLLGTYESELYPYLLQFAQSGLEEIIVLGCAEGYYAVGLARLIPHATVHAYDIDPAARSACQKLAAANAVQDRVLIGGEFQPKNFEAYANRRALIVADIEGAEDDILQPALSPSLSGMSLIVETHDFIRPGVLLRLTERFQSTHDIVRVDPLQPKQCVLPAWLQDLPDLDQLMSVWEWRAGSSPWLVMVPRNEP